MVPRYTVPFQVQVSKLHQKKLQLVDAKNWLVRTGVGCTAAWKLACDPANAHLTFWPGLSVAMCLGEKLEGKAFATLPTGIKTKFPVHVNARWCVSDNRKSLIVGDDPSHARYAKWNQSLISDGVSSLWAELLEEARSANLSGDKTLMILLPDCLY